jgi:hypothetical protein
LYDSSSLGKTCQLTFKRIGKSSVISSSQPRSVAAGDFNKDNRMDIVVANSGTSTIGIFLSHTDGTLADQKTYPTGSQSHPYSVIVNDFNDDNHLDIAVANHGTNNIGVFLGYGDGTFSNQAIVSTGSSRPLFIITSDFNDDNRSDIAVANDGTNSVSIFLGYGDGSFQLQTTYATGYDSLPHALGVGDFNNDNRIDIAVANIGTDNIGILLGYGNGNFANQQTYTTTHGSNPSSITVGDFNNDDQLDIAVANNGTGNIGVLLGFGNGTFAAQRTYFINSNAHPQYITIGDFNGDNQSDIVIVDSTNDEMYIILGYDNGTFTNITTYDAISGSQPFLINVADLNNDNQSDIIMVNYGNNNVLVLIGYTSKPDARQKNYYFVRSTPGFVVVSDFNNDNYLDIAASGLIDDSITVLTGDSNGTFGSKKIFSTGNNSDPQQLCVNDLNNDNLMDIVIANMDSDSVGVLLGQGNVTFAIVKTYSTGYGTAPQRIAVDDISNDNRLDIISANYVDNSISVLLGHGNGSFANAVIYYTGSDSSPSSITVGNVNNDNYPDLIITNYKLGSVSIIFGYGNGTFRRLKSYSTGYNSAPVSVALADFNNDNQADIVVANSITGNIGVLLGYGNETFETQTTYSAGLASSPTSVAIADFNHDSQLDIAVTALGNDEVILFFGLGNGRFQLARTYFTGNDSRPYDIVVADLNNDKQLEIVTTLWGTGNIAVLTEYLAAKFEIQTTYLTGSAAQLCSIAIGDFNNDNRSDVVVANSGTDNLGIYFGLDNGTFGSQITFSTGFDSHPQYVITGDINNDSYVDMITIDSEHDRISMIMGYGNSSFAVQKLYPVDQGSHPSAVLLDDLNHDNRSDVVIVNAGTDSISILIGYDYASFENRGTYRSTNNAPPQAVVTSDFNNDNYLDIALAFDEGGNVGILLGFGNGSFGTMITYAMFIDSQLTALAVDDINKDGKMDIAVTDYGTSNVIILLGYGNGSFVTGMTFFTGPGSVPYAINIADFNNDSRLDIAVANALSYNVGILLGYGNGTFATMLTYSTGYRSFPVAVASGDFNKDGRRDIAVTNRDTTNVGVLLGYGDGRFSNQVTYSTGISSQSYSIAIDDFNSDGQLDIATANFNGNSVAFFIGRGDGTFLNMQAYITEIGSLPRYLTTGDFNNDNRLDFIVVNYGTNDIVVCFGFEKVTYYEGSTYSTGTGSGPITLATGNFNNDSRLDFVVVNFLTKDISVFLGYGSEPFGSITTYNIGSGSNPRAASHGDFNNDGRSDIVVANYGTNSVGVLFGPGDGTFATISTYSTGVGSAPCSIAVGHFNNDSHSDLVVINCELDNFVILLGVGNGTFAMGATYSTEIDSRPYAVAIADFNNDNNMDIVVANSGTNNILLFYGNGNGTFGNKESYPLGYDYRPYSIAVNDLNHDGWMDIVIACYGTDHIEILMKTC